MQTGTDFGDGDPALAAALAERAPQDGLLRLLRDADFTGHAKQLEHELLLGKKTEHQGSAPCGSSEGRRFCQRRTGRLTASAASGESPTRRGVAGAVARPQAGRVTCLRADGPSEVI